MPKTLIFLLGLLFFTSCEKETKTGEVDLVFYLTYKGQPLIMFDTFQYPVNNQKMVFTKFAAYLSEVSFDKQDGGNVDALEIDLLDLTNAHNKENASKGFTYTLKNIEEGAYKSFNFSIGVPPQLNSKTPKDFSSDHILSSTTNYWSSWKSYIFTRTEGKIDTDGDQVLEKSVSLHAGGDEAFVSFKGEKNMIVAEGQKTKIELFIDMEKYFNGKSLYDINTYPSLHSLEHKPAILILRDNLATAISFR